MDTEIERELSYLRTKANSGDAKAMVEFADAIVTLGDPISDLEIAGGYRLAYKFLKKAAAQKYPPAYYTLSRYFLRKGIPGGRSVAKSFYYSKRAGACRARWDGSGWKDGNIIEAQFEVANMLERGFERHKRSPSQAFRWYKIAACNGHVDAQYMTGYKLLHGSGIRKNVKEAMKWWRRACQGGSPKAACNLGKVFEEGSTGYRRPKLAFLYYKRSHDMGGLGSELGTYNLFRCYKFGIGIEKDPRMAKKLSILAYRQLCRAYQLFHQADVRRVLQRFKDRAPPVAP